MSRKAVTYTNVSGSGLGDRLVLGQGKHGEERWVADDAGLGVAVDVGLPLPAGGVGVASPDVLGLQPLEFLLGAEFVRLGGLVRASVLLTLCERGQRNFWRGRVDLPFLWLYVCVLCFALLFFLPSGGERSVFV